MTPRCCFLICAALMACCSPSLATEFIVEDWSTHPVGTRGIPAGWERQPWTSGDFDFTVVESGDHKVLHMKSVADGPRICKVLKDIVDVKATPILEWSWKVVTLPKGGDARKRATDDQAAQLYVTWPRFPEAFRSRTIGYIWNSVPIDHGTLKSLRSMTITYVVVRSGPADLGRWVTERRNLREDYMMIYGEEPDNPAVITFGIDSNDTKSSAESFMGSIIFRKAVAQPSTRQ